MIQAKLTVHVPGDQRLALREAEAWEKGERRRRDLTRARIFAEILGLAFLISAGLALYGNQKRIEALEQTDLAIQQKKLAEKRERSNRQLFYVARMNLAQKAFSEGDSGRGNEHLNTALPTAAHAPRDDMRSFGWYLLWQLHHHEKATLAEHAGRVSSVAFAPDGKTLAWGGQEGTVKLWDVTTRRALATLEGGAANVASIAFAGTPISTNLRTINERRTCFLIATRMRPSARLLLPGRSSA